MLPGYIEIVFKCTGLSGDEMSTTFTKPKGNVQCNNLVLFQHCMSELTDLLTISLHILSCVTISVKVNSYTAEYPVLRTAQIALHFTSLTDLFNRTPSQFLWEASSRM